MVEFLCETIDDTTVIPLCACRCYLSRAPLPNPKLQPPLDVTAHPGMDTCGSSIAAAAIIIVVITGGRKMISYIENKVDQKHTGVLMVVVTHENPAEVKFELITIN